MKQIKPVIWGIAIIALGIIFGGHALGLFELNIFFDGWWTLFIIIPSFISLFTDKEKLSNLGFLSAGVILLLAAQNVFSYEVAWKVILAAFLVIAGLTIIIKSLVHNKNDQEVAKKIAEAEKDGKSMDSQMAVFSGSDRTYKDEVFQGSNLVAVFGGAKLNLKKAKFDKDTVIKAFTLFGGIDIIVPSDVKVKLKSGFIFGGFSDDRKNATGEGKYTIYIDAAGGFGGISITIFYAAIILIITWFLLNRTRFGYYIYALGGNKLAAQYSGVNVKLFNMLPYVLIGLFSGIGGMIWSARLGSAAAMLGSGFEMDAIAAVVIGGTSMSGGVGTVGGTLIGVLIMGVITNGLNLIGINAFWQDVMKGAIIMAAVIFDVMRKRKTRQS